MRCAWVLGSVPSVFERPHHQRIAHVLGALNAPLLRQSNCLFGGGAAIALKYGEYRESVDIDFLVSDVSSYRALRQLLTGPLGFGALVREVNPDVVLHAAADEFSVLLREGKGIAAPAVACGASGASAPPPRRLQVPQRPPAKPASLRGTCSPRAQPPGPDLALRRRLPACVQS